MLGKVMTMPETFSTPQQIAEAGRKLYQERYREEYEAKYPGQFAAIDVRSGDAFVAEEPEQAVNEARTARPDAIVHLIRVGASGAFRVSYASNADHEWGV